MFIYDGRSVRAYQTVSQLEIRTEIGRKLSEKNSYLFLTALDGSE